MRVLALDLASSIGWAIGSTVGGRVSHGVHKLPVTGDDIGRFLDIYVDWLTAIIEQFGPEELVFEQPILTKVKNLKTLRKLYSLSGVTEMTARRCRVRCLEANQSAIRVHFIGVHVAPRTIKDPHVRSLWLKRRVMAKAKDRGFTVIDHNDADAIAILDYRLAQKARNFVLRQVSLLGEAA